MPILWATPFCCTTQTAVTFFTLDVLSFLRIRRCLTKTAGKEATQTYLSKGSNPSPSAAAAPTSRSSSAVWAAVPTCYLHLFIVFSCLFFIFMALQAIGNNDRAHSSAAHSLTSAWAAVVSPCEAAVPTVLPKVLMHPLSSWGPHGHTDTSLLWPYKRQISFCPRKVSKAKSKATGLQKALCDN